MLGLSNNLASGGFVDTFANLKSISLDGSDEYVDIADDSSLNFGASTDFTVSCWAKYTADGYMGLVSKGVGGEDGGWEVVISNANGKLYGRIEQTGGASVSVESSLEYNDGNWHHFVVVYDRSALMTLYVDGSATGNTGDISSIGDIDTTHSLDIGRQTSGANYFTGNLDGVAIWNSVLSANAVAEIYANGKGIDLRSNSGDYTSASSLVGYWRCGDGKLGADADGTNDVIFDMDNASLGSEMVVGDDLDFDTVGNWSGNGATLSSEDDGGEHTSVLKILTTSGDLNDRAELAQSNLSTTTVAGKVYRCTFDYRYVQNTSMSHNGGVTIGNTLKADIIYTNTSWTAYDTLFTATDNSTNIRIYANISSGASGNILYIDNFSIKPVNGNPATMVNMEEADIQTEVPKQVKGLPAVSNTYSLDFDGTDDIVNCGDTNNLGTGDFTISCWAKADDWTDSYILTKWADSNNRWYFGGDSSDNITFYSKATSVGIAVTGGSMTSYEGAWVHIVMVADRSTSTTFYVNGVISGSVGSGSVVDIDNSADLKIGGDQYWFDGSLDEIGIFNTALDSDSIRAIYNNGVPTNLKNNTGAYDEYTDNLVAYYRMGDGTLDSYPLIGDEVTPTLGSEQIGGDNFATAHDYTDGVEFNGWRMNTTSGGMDDFDTAEVVDGKIHLVSTGSTNYKAFYAPFSEGFVSGKVYKIEYELSTTGTFGEIRASVNTSTMGSSKGYNITHTSSENVSTYFTATGTYSSSVLEFWVDDDNATCDVLLDNVSFKEVNGNAGILTNMSESDIAEDTP